MRATMIAAILASCTVTLAADATLRIGFVDPSLPGAPARQNAAALSFAGTRGHVVRLRPSSEGALVPPFNLDCYFQHFSRKGVPVPLGVLGPAGFIHPGMLSPSR